MVEVQLPDDSSVDDAIIWAQKILAAGNEQQRAAAFTDEPQREHRVVSAAPVRK
jgi:hypothetical protein